MKLLVLLSCYKMKVNTHEPHGRQVTLDQQQRYGEFNTFISNILLTYLRI